MSAGLHLLAALAVTLGVMMLALRLLQKVRAGGVSRVPLRVLQRVETGPKQAIALVQVVDRVLVVSLAESGSRLLTELTEGERERVLVAEAAPATTTTTATPARPGLSWAAIARSAGLGAWVLAALLAVSAPASAQSGAPAPSRGRTTVAAAPVAPAVPGPGLGVPNPPKMSMSIGQGPGSLQMTGTVGLVVFMGFLTLLPAIVLLMTSFTRILIVLHFLRSALGTQTTPPSQLLAAIAILLTAVIMNPTLQRTQQEALQPYFDGRISQTEAYERGIVPFREFMLTHTREKDLAMFAEASGAPADRAPEQLPIVTIISAFVTSELRTAFQMGFALFLPFVVVDLVVASVLMSLGMFMLPPAMISLPFKLLLFVLADGWSLVFQNLILSFR
ncbi:MAG: flagellar type III secretion system pore protein FliP [bacterium]